MKADGYTVARNAEQTYVGCLSVAPLPGLDVEIQWNAIPGRSYQVEVTSDGQTYGSFLDPVTATSITTSVIHTAPVEPVRFYRLRRLPVD